ncbi:MAG: protein-tyrosine-phosphatase [Chloroflexi bacterium]|nr:protein-tyrosine-phosphatase [Chloroflexota bacterium]
MDSGSLDPPLRVDWLEPAELNDGAPGRLGMTSLPGKQGPSFRYPGRVYRRELGRDLDALRNGGIRHLLLLVEDEELDRWGDPEIVRHGAERGVTVDRRPLRDGNAPRSAREMDETLEALTAARHSGDVAVACMGGVGRTGTVAACALVAAGRTAAGAIERVREVRHPTAVETREQVAFVHAYERHVATRRGRPGKVAP